MDPPASARGGTQVWVPGLNATRPLRYLLVRPCCQLCNRLRVLVSAIALGLLTERAVLMDFDAGYYGRFADLFASPLSPLASKPPYAKQGELAVSAGRSLQWWWSVGG